MAILTSRHYFKIYSGELVHQFIKATEKRQINLDSAYIFFSDGVIVKTLREGSGYRVRFARSDEV
ncbi:hypothetical protein NIES23_64440 (plasmid) [Trichormus variabilis NIES-23]|uniref:Uncharacterized protein n=1 Tax=Trichormus variabilis NIES-23 TaxID=1973479 RepID=A0A1Z4KXH6_ANAVA|nr:hypothetical protein NIES23_64440 [Trichormus variabilis NIES-23]